MEWWLIFCETPHKFWQIVKIKSWNWWKLHNRQKVTLGNNVDNIWNLKSWWNKGSKWSSVSQVLVITIQEFKSYFRPLRAPYLLRPNCGLRILPAVDRATHISVWEVVWILPFFMMLLCLRKGLKMFFRTKQGGRTWKAFGGGKNGHETFRQARIYNFRDKCVFFAHNLKFSNLTQ